MNTPICKASGQAIDGNDKRCRQCRFIGCGKVVIRYGHPTEVVCEPRTEIHAIDCDLDEDCSCPAGADDDLEIRAVCTECGADLTAGIGAAGEYVPQRACDEHPRAPTAHVGPGGLALSGAMDSDLDVLFRARNHHDSYKALKSIFLVRWSEGTDE